MAILVSSKLRKLLSLCLAILITLAASLPSATPIRGQAGMVRRVNAPFFSPEMKYEEAAIFWFGRVTSTENYADVRVGYTSANLYVAITVFDRFMFTDPTPLPEDLANWDAVSLYLNRDGNTGATPSTSSYRLVGQVQASGGDSPNYRTSYHGTGSAWQAEAVPFSTISGSINEHGWSIFLRAPFASLGLSGPPAPGTIWGLALQLHDRDDAAGTAIPAKLWPENMTGMQPATWGQLHFGLPTYTPPPSQPGGTVTIRQGLNGANVPDAGVGGTIGYLCPHWSTSLFNQWGNQNFAGAIGVNVQNQLNIADWPCFSKYYLTFPLNIVPIGKAIQSATLTLHQWGGSDPTRAQPSLIQVLTVAEDWIENTITWNNAPLALENVSQAWVGVVDDCGAPGGTPWPCVPRQFDLSRAVAQAYADGIPLRLAIYEADRTLHSGKFFTTSDEGNWNAVGRPTLTVVWGEAFPPLSKKPQPVAVDSGGSVTFTLQWSGNGQPLTLTDSLPEGFSAPVGLSYNLGSAEYSAGTRQITWNGAPAEAQLVTLSYSVTVQASGPLALTNSAQLSGDDGSSNATATVIVDGFKSLLPLVSR